MQKCGGKIRKLNGKRDCKSITAYFPKDEAISLSTKLLTLAIDDLESDGDLILTYHCDDLDYTLLRNRKKK